MSPSVLRRPRPRRLLRPYRGRYRRPERVAISNLIATGIRLRSPVIGSALVVTAVWSIATGSYFTFRDNALDHLMTENQITHDHIAALDHIMNRRFINQEQVEQKINALLRRQVTLEQHTSALSDVISATGSITLVSTAPPVIATRSAESASNRGVNGVLSRVALSLDKVEHRQAVALTDFEERIDSRARTMRSVLVALGVDTAKTSGSYATGGPFVSIKSPQSDGGTFEHHLHRIKLVRAQIDHLNRLLVAVPIRKPVSEVDMTSPFGVRADPFFGRPAFHPGIDLRGDVGEPVFATAAGCVTTAGRQGGYGNMVEIDHGNGLITRFGHLSEIDVKVDQRVRINEVIGKVGSTGRSTGPHLHYETRINGEAVDPQKFFRAGLSLGQF
jgi:murein DD-endopeptidase MepM/ murein hydrolase activator NlpD